VLALIFLATASLPEKAHAEVVIGLIQATNDLVLGSAEAFAAFRGTSEQVELHGSNISLAREPARSIGVNLCNIKDIVSIAP